MLLKIISLHGVKNLIKSNLSSLYLGDLSGEYPICDSVL